MYIDHHVKCRLFLSDCNETWILSTVFRKILKFQIVRKINPVGAEFFHADGQTDMMKLIAAFRNFAKARTSISRLCLVLHRMYKTCTECTEIETWMKSVFICWLNLSFVLHLEFLPNSTLHNDAVGYGECFVLNTKTGYVIYCSLTNKWTFY